MKIFLICIRFYVVCAMINYNCFRKCCHIKSSLHASMNNLMKIVSDTNSEKMVMDKTILLYICIHKRLVSTADIHIIGSDKHLSVQQTVNFHQTAYMKKKNGSIKRIFDPNIPRYTITWMDGMEVCL